MTRGHSQNGLRDLDVRGAEALPSDERRLAEVDTGDGSAGCALRLAATRVEVP